jgi:hypothetical protein
MTGMGTDWGRESKEPFRLALNFSRENPVSPSSIPAPFRRVGPWARRVRMADSRKRFGPVISDKCAKKRDISAANCFY